MSSRHHRTTLSRAAALAARGCLLGFLLTGPCHVRSADAQFMIVTGNRTRLTLEPPLMPGLDPQPDEDDKTRIMWHFAPPGWSKIVVGTLAPGQSFRLFAEAQDVFRANGVGEIELADGLPAQDFIRDIRRIGSLGRARIYFRAEAPAGTGNSQLFGDDNHTVTFTWTAQ